MADAPYTFAYSETALGFLEGLPKKLRSQVIDKIERLATNPCPPGCKLVRGMQDNDEQVWRIRSGDYRVLYVVRDRVIVVLDIDHRKDIYR